MRIARVVGRVVATRKELALVGQKLLVLKPIDAQGRERGESLVALDTVGAGPGEIVYWVRGREASFPFLPAEVPADAVVAGILDPTPARR